MQWISGDDMSSDILPRTPQLMCSKNTLKPIVEMISIPNKAKSPRGECRKAILETSQSYLRGFWLMIFRYISRFSETS